MLVMQFSHIVYDTSQIPPELKVRFKNNIFVTPASQYEPFIYHHYHEVNLFHKQCTFPRHYTITFEVHCHRILE